MSRTPRMDSVPARVRPFRRSRLAALIGVALTGLAVTGLALVPIAGHAGAPERWEPPRKFTLVYNVNNAGYVDVCGCKHKEVKQGSLTRRASFLKQLRATGREILLLDGGSSLFAIADRVKEAQLAEEMRKAEVIIEAYNRIGYRAMAVGAFDLAAGLDNLKALEKRAKFTFLSANLADKATGKLHFTPSTVVEVGGLRVGIFGLTLETLSKVYLEKVAPDIVLLDPLEAAKKTLADFGGKVDLVIALSHLREETNFELLKQLRDLEIVVDPCIQYQNHHTYIKEDEWVSFRDDALVLRSDGQGARLGLLDIEMTASRGKLASEDRLLELQALVDARSASDKDKEELQALRGKNRFRFSRVSLEPHHLTDPEIDLLVENWKKNIDPAKVQRFEDQLPSRGDYLTVEKCKSCHEPVFEFWKKTKHSTALASLVATGDQHRYDCVGCHTLGYGKAFLNTANMAAYAGVQCESCHGTNPKHAEDPKANHFPRLTKESCIVCHNKEQTRKEFNFAAERRQVACPKG